MVSDFQAQVDVSDENEMKTGRQANSEVVHGRFGVPGFPTVLLGSGMLLSTVPETFLPADTKEETSSNSPSDS